MWLRVYAISNCARDRADDVYYHLFIVWTCEMDRRRADSVVRRDSELGNVISLLFMKEMFSLMYHIAFF